MPAMTQTITSTNEQGATGQIECARVCEDELAKRMFCFWLRFRSHVRWESEARLRQQAVLLGGCRLDGREDGREVEEGSG